MELEKDKMETLQRLAQVNIEISKGKATLQNLKDDIDDFLKEREVIEKGVIDRVYEESKELIGEIYKNYEEVNTYYNEVRSYGVFLKELQDNIHNQIATFKEHSQGFIEYASKEENRLAELRKDIQTDTQIIKQEQETMSNMKLELEKEKRHLESKQETLANSYQELKKIWNK